MARAKSNKSQTMAFRLEQRLADQLDAFREAHKLPPSRTAVLEAALREYLEKNNPAEPLRKSA